MCDEDKIRRINRLRLRAVNSATQTPPELICEKCGFEDCICETCSFCQRPLDIFGKCEHALCESRLDERE